MSPQSSRRSHFIDGCYCNDLIVFWVAAEAENSRSWLPMNWRRGLMRAWVLLSVPWTLFFAATAFDAVVYERRVDALRRAGSYDGLLSAAHARSSTQGLFDDLIPDTTPAFFSPEVWWPLAIAVFGPLSLLAIGFSLRWVLMGFRA